MLTSTTVNNMPLNELLIRVEDVENLSEKEKEALLIHACGILGNTPDSQASARVRINKLL